MPNPDAAAGEHHHNSQSSTMPSPPPPSSSPPPPHHNTTTNNNNHLSLPSSPDSISSGEPGNSPSHSNHHIPISAPDSSNPSYVSSSSDHSLHDLINNEIIDNEIVNNNNNEISPAPPPVVNRLIKDESKTLVSITKLEPRAATGHAEERGNDDAPDKEKISGIGGGGGGVRVRKEVLSVRWVKKREVMVKRVGLGLRVFEFVTCLVSFSIMATDRGKGWALDSFDRYLEFRYCVSVSILGFACSGFQGLDLVFQLTTSNLKSRRFLRCCFDFTSDQILAYLLASASSSAAARTDDWITNWGKDKFPAMAGASVGMSFLAFLAFALSSVISGYVLCTHR